MGVRARTAPVTGGQVSDKSSRARSKLRRAKLDLRQALRGERDKGTQAAPPAASYHRRLRAGRTEMQGGDGRGRVRCCGENLQVRGSGQRTGTQGPGSP